MASRFAFWAEARKNKYKLAAIICEVLMRGLHHTLFTRSFCVGFDSTFSIPSPTLHLSHLPTFAYPRLCLALSAKVEFGC